MTPTRLLEQLVMQAAIDHTSSGNFDGPLRQPYLGLIKAPFVEGRSLVRSDIEEANFTGYARLQVTTWGTQYQSTDGAWSFTDGVKQWQMTDTVTPNSIYGIGYFDAATTGNLLGTELFDTPINLTTVTQAVNYVPTIALPNEGTMGVGDLIS